LMPIHEIGQKHRKGSLGSPYAVKDYYSVNPHLGTLADLKHFVTAAHELGMFVILDWVANHTAWDNNLVSEHPEWYARDWKGDFCPTPWWDWPDIIDLDYQHSALREYMTKAMKYGFPRSTSTATGATWRALFQRIFGTTCEENSTLLNQSSCSLSGSPATRTLKLLI
jgi:Alpha amylase, catalytic domain